MLKKEKEKKYQHIMLRIMNPRSIVGFRRLRQSHRHDVVEPAFGQRLQQQRGLGVGAIAPCHADGTDTTAVIGGERLAAQHGGGGAFRGLDGRRRPSDLESVSFERDPVDVLSPDLTDSPTPLPEPDEVAR